jgi:putative phosphoribosyl transferase
MIFKDRADAGRVLARLLHAYADRDDVVVLALPRGGVPVGYEISRALNVPLDIFVVRKLGVPGHEELAMGAVATGGTLYLNHDVIAALGIDLITIEKVSAIEEEEIRRRERAYRGDRPPLRVEGKTVILVDDGLATGSTMRAAIAALHQQDPARIVVAVPAGSLEVCKDVGQEADEAICATMPESFHAVSQWYAEFRQTTDEEVRDLLSRSSDAASVSIGVNGDAIKGDLTRVAHAKGIVIFSHGSGSSRQSPRNRFVAGVLNQHGFATLLVDLLTVEEEVRDNQTLEHRFDIDLLAGRLVAATDWVMNHAVLSMLPVGYFGASTGAAAALVAAAERREVVQAIVSRGGRPDLAGDALKKIDAPTLLIVGELDQAVVRLNGEAMEMMPGETRIEVIPGATHLFEERGALGQVAALASEWFVRKLVRKAA